MSTLSGIAAKGEKGKSKFQSLDINNLYKASRGESLETHQHKNTQSRRHGMQTLGKIPSARRAPANLPSLKSEYSGNDPAISLVPSGGTGWGSKPGETGPPPSSTQTATSTTPTPTVSSSTATVAVTATVSTVTPSVPPVSAPPPPPPTVSHGDKSWSSITSSTSEASPMFLAHQSPYFQQEFPSLSGDASAGGPNKGDPGHLPGPSLRPQTEGSWMQGGSRPQGQMGAGAGNQPGTVPVPGPLPHPHLPQGLDVGGGRNNLGPSGVGVGPGGPMPPAGMAPHHFRLMPQFMLRHNHPSGGFPPNFHGPPRFRFPYPPDTRMMPPNRGPPINPDQDEHSSRPIIKEEDLKVMDEIAKDTSWATHDEIDYNQTLTFSDDDGTKEEKRNQAFDKRDSMKKMQERDSELMDSGEKANRENLREMMPPAQNEREPPKGWQQPRPADMRHGGPPPPMGNFPPQPPRVTPHQGTRQGEDDEVWRERRRLQNEEIAIAVERAKQRKEEEEKRYIETRQNAARKLQMLEEKMRSKTGGDKEDSQSSTANLQQTSNALLPDWEKEKNRSRKNSEDKDEKSSKESLDHVKPQQVDNRGGFNRERERERDREARPERDNTQGFSRMFQNNLPPRFQKQAADRPPYYRQGSGSSPQPTSAQPSYPSDPRWSTNSQYGGSAGNIKQSRADTSERDREDIKEPLRDRERNLSDMGYDNRDRERYNRPPSRDRKDSWKAASYTEEPVSKSSADSEHNYECDNRLHEKSQENEESKDKEKKYNFYEDGNVNLEKRSSESFKSMHSSQEDSFNHRDKMMSNDGERRDNLTKLEMKERPQRPDSRDSRASRESRNSRDSNPLFEESSLHESSVPWSDSTYEVENREEKLRKDNRDEPREHRREIHPVHQQSSYYQRHIPGPITKEKLEAAEKCESSKNMNLVPLIRGDKKPDNMKPINQWETSSSGADAWQQVPSLSECWADVTPSLPAKSQPTPPHSPEVREGNKAESLEKKVEHEDSNKSVPKASFQEKEEDSNQRPMSSSDMQRGDKGGSRGGNRGMRHERGPRGWGGGGSYYRGAANPYRGGDQRGRRAQNRRPVGREWGHSESEASADEVSASTEAGKHDKRHEQDRTNYSRSPKQGNRRSEKDDRPRDGRKPENDKDGYPGGNDNRRHDKRGMYDNTRMGSFEPRGEPSRRGRGAPFRSKGSAANVGRRMDGYGPPTSKRPFTSDSNSNSRDEKKTDASSLMQMVNKDEAYSKLSHDEKMKLNQQQLAAGIIGGARLEFKSQPQNMPPRLRRKSEGERRERKPRERGVQNSGKSGSGSGGEMDENWETTSETSEHEEREEDRRNDRRSFPASNRGYPRRQPQPNRSNGGGKDGRRGNSFDRDGEHPSRMSGPPPLMNGGIRPTGGKAPISNKDQQDPKSSDYSMDKNKNRFENKEKRNNLDKIDLCNTASVVVVDDQPEGTVEQDRTVFATDNNGFQEVRSKKNVKEANRQKEEPQKGSRERERERDRDRSKKSGGSQSPAQVPGTTVPTSKGSYDRDRPRGGKLPPRFAKLRETNRLQKIAQQQTQDVTEVNKVNVSNVQSFPMKDLTNPPPPPPVNAWDKPINAALRTSTPPAPGPTISPLEEPCNIDSNEPDNSTASSQRSSPNGDKLLNKISREPAEKAVLDGTSPPVQTIIFENTNYKSVPGDSAMKSKYNTNHLPKPQRTDKPRERKLDEENVSLGFKSPGPDMKLQDTKNDPIQMPMSFNKNEDNADMKLDFRFDSDLSQLTEDKTSKSMTSMQMNRSIQMASQSSAADLQFKLASVKKVWENPASVLEHGGEDSSSVATATSFTPTFTNSVDDSTSYGKPSDSNVPDDTNSITPENVYNPSQQMSNSANSYNGGGVNMMKPDPSSNVCKVKPQPQAALHPHGGPLSPPAGPFATSNSQPGQHLSYQPQAQYGGMSAIPSPPTVFTAQPEIYQTFQINNPPQVLGSQGRSGFSQFASQGLGYISQGLGQTSGYSQQSLYHVQTGPPPTAQPPPPDVFQTQLSQYRIQPPAYGTSQQLSNNPSTVLISSSANSLMSASVKPSAQPPIGAIGTKAGSYQTTSQPPHSQLYIYPDPQMLSQSPYLQSSQLVQRPANNVMQTIPPSSASYYSATTGGGAGGFFQPGNSNMQAGPSLHQTTFNMQAFNTQSAAPTPAGMGSFGSQMAQQYRSTAPLPSYLKSADHQDHLSVFSSPSPVTQINPAKPRGGCGNGGGGSGGKQGSQQQQPSPTQGHHQFSSYQQNVSATTQFVLQMIQQQQQQQQRGAVNMRSAPRYPAPIQRPDSLPVCPGGRRLPNNSRAPTYNKPPPAASASQSAANVNYYVSQSDSTKLNNSDLDAKVDTVHSECEPASNGKPADIAVESSTAEN